MRPIARKLKLPKYVKVNPTGKESFWVKIFEINYADYGTPMIMGVVYNDIFETVTNSSISLSTNELNHNDYGHRLKFGDVVGFDPICVLDVRY